MAIAAPAPARTPGSTGPTRRIASRRRASRRIRAGAVSAALAARPPILRSLRSGVSLPYRPGCVTAAAPCGAFVDFGCALDRRHPGEGAAGRQVAAARGQLRRRCAPRAGRGDPGRHGGRRPGAPTRWPGSCWCADQHSDDPHVLVQNRPGLNAALAEAAAHADSTWPHDGVAALVGDLPALRSEELADALRTAARHPRAHRAGRRRLGHDAAHRASPASTSCRPSAPARRRGTGWTPRRSPAAARAARTTSTPPRISLPRRDLGLGAATAAAVAARQVTPCSPERGIVNAMTSHGCADHGSGS